MSQDSIAELKPCPFCGQPAETVGTSSATCRGYRGDQWIHHSVLMPIKQWNTRTQPPACSDGLVEQLLELIPFLEAHHCSAQVVTEAAGRITVLEADRAKLRSRLKALHEALTPSAETKAAYVGEFSFALEDTDDEWGLPITRHLDVPWTTIKEVMAAILALAALSDTQGGE